VQRTPHFESGNQARDRGPLVFEHERRHQPASAAHWPGAATTAKFSPRMTTRGVGPRSAALRRRWPALTEERIVAIRRLSPSLIVWQVRHELLNVSCPDSVSAASGVLSRPRNRGTRAFSYPIGDRTAQFVMGDSKNTITLARSSADVSPPYGFMLLPRSAVSGLVCATFLMRLGPNLHNIIGRKAGSVPNYGYSSAMKGADFVWDKEKLDRFIAKPDEVVPGTGDRQRDVIW
jgi:hypothetical protein